MCLQRILIHFSQAYRALTSCYGPMRHGGSKGEQSQARHQSSASPSAKATSGSRGPLPAACAAWAQPWPTTTSTQGAPARERLCSCSSAPASSTSSRPLSEPSKQPESRGMSHLGSDTVCTTGSWLLSVPSSASSLPAARGKSGRWNMGFGALEGRDSEAPGNSMWE